MKSDSFPNKPVEALEVIEDVNLKDPTHERSEATDYAGAALKSDPEEIRLVRKLDVRIMVPSIPTTEAVTDFLAAHVLHHVFP
jgi:hypothetical protein